MTLKQEKELKQQMLLNDLNYIIDNIIVDLRNDFQDNLYYMYNYYLENKNELLEKTLNSIKNQKVEILKEIATNNGFEFKKVLIDKHDITLNNVYMVAELIENLFDKKINELIKQFKQQQKTKEYLKDTFNNDDNKSPPEEKPKFQIMGLSLFSFIIAVIVGICDGFSNTKKRR